MPECGHEVALEKRLNEIRRLEGINAKLLEALERTTADLRDVMRLIREGRNDPRSEWPRAELGLVEADTAIREAKGE